MIAVVLILLLLVTVLIFVAHWLLDQLTQAHRELDVLRDRGCSTCVGSKAGKGFCGDCGRTWGVA